MASETAVRTGGAGRSGAASPAVSGAVTGIDSTNEPSAEGGVGFDTDGRGMDVGAAGAGADEEVGASVGSGRAGAGEGEGGGGRRLGGRGSTCGCVWRSSLSDRALFFMLRSGVASLDSREAAVLASPASAFGFDVGSAVARPGAGTAETDGDASSVATSGRAGCASGTATGMSMNRPSSSTWKRAVASSAGSEGRNFMLLPAGRFA